MTGVFEEPSKRVLKGDVVFSVRVSDEMLDAAWAEPAALAVLLSDAKDLLTEAVMREIGERRT